jgi:hypothetical protein
MFVNLSKSVEEDDCQELKQRRIQRRARSKRVVLADNPSQWIKRRESWPQQALLPA